MNEPQSLPPVQVVVLTRLLAGGLKGATSAQLRKDVGALLDAAAADALGPALEALEASGLVERDGRSKAGRYGLSEGGRARAMAALGLHALPPKTTWAKLRSAHLPALALGLDPLPSGDSARRFATKGGFEAALLTSAHGLPLSGVPTAKQAADALLWKALGVNSAAPFTLAAVKRWLLARDAAEVGPGPAPADEKKAMRRMVVRAAGARRDAPAELREAVVRRWVAGAASSSRAAPAPSEEPLPAVLEYRPQPDAGAIERPFDLHAFAREVLQVADDCPSGRFGASRVFIAHVWRALRARPGYEQLEIDAFKRRLVEANQARLLDLGRADLVEAMDPEDVRASETRHLGAAFHFVRVGGTLP